MRWALLSFWICLLAVPAFAADRDTQVRKDKAAFADSKDWIYNKLDEGIQAAKKSGKPLFVVFRCIPCEACAEFDDDVARRDPIIRDLLDQYVCVRIPQANAIDLTRFQHDFDQSFAAYMMNPNLTIYARFGTRSERPEHEDISLQGLRKTMEAALQVHRDGAPTKPVLAGKQVHQPRYRTPRDYPSLAGKYGDKVDYDQNPARSCMHCHQIREAERLVYRSASEAIPDEVLFPYPDPGVLGLKMDPKEIARVESVAADSIAARTGLLPGDNIQTLDGQPLFSTADLQWVLHNGPAAGSLKAELRRDGQTRTVMLELPEGWRRRGNISWRVTTWDLRRMALGGMHLVELSEADRAKAGIAAGALGLKADYVGEHGDHAVAKRAGIRKGDLLVSFDGLETNLRETDLIAHAVQRKRPRDRVRVTVLRDGARITTEFALQ